MPAPPRSGESKSAFIGRCVKYWAGEQESLEAEGEERHANSGPFSTTTGNLRNCRNAWWRTQSQSNPSQHPTIFPAPPPQGVILCR